MRIVPGTAWRLPEFLTGDFPGWIAVAVGVAVLVIAYKALRRPLTQLIFGHALSIEYDQTEKSATVTARAVIVSLATSFIWDVVSCRIKIGEEETSLPQVVINSHMVLGNTYVLTFTGPIDIKSTEATGTVEVGIRTYDGGQISQTWRLDTSELLSSGSVNVPMPMPIRRGRARRTLSRLRR